MKFINTLVINIIKRDLAHARKSYFISLPRLSYRYWLIYFKYEQMNLNLWIWFISKGLIYANESSLAKADSCYMKCSTKIYQLTF